MRAVRASSSPAGSSASSSAGACASAAQAATRCCSPPESSEGGSSARSARPMPSSSASARSPALVRRDAAQRQRQRDVVGAGERGGERARVVLIEEAEPLRAERGGAPRAEPHDVDAERARDAGGRPVEAGGDAQQRALARAARAEHDAALAARDRERHALQRDGARGAVRVDAEDVAQLECERLASLGPLLPGDAAPGGAAAVGDAQRGLDERGGEHREQRRRPPAIVIHGVMRWSGGSGTASVASTASRRPVATARPMPSPTPASDAEQGEAEGAPAHARAQRTRARALRFEIEEAVALVAQEPERRERDAEQRERERGDGGGDERRDDASRDRIALQVAVDRRRARRRRALRRAACGARPRAAASCARAPRARARRGSTRAGRRRRARRRATPRRRSRSCRPSPGWSGSGWPWRRAAHARPGRRTTARAPGSAPALGGDVGARDDGQSPIVERLARAEHGLLRGVDHVAQRQRVAVRADVERRRGRARPRAASGRLRPWASRRRAARARARPQSPSRRCGPRRPRAPPSAGRWMAAVPGWP